MGNPYKADFLNPDGTTRIGGSINFTDPANQPGGGSSFPEVAATTDLGLAAPQTLTSGTTQTGIVLAVQGADEIGLVALGGGAFQLPDGWYLASAQVYLALNATGSRYIGFGQFGNTLGPSAFVSGEGYALLDNGNGLTLGPALFQAKAPNNSLALQATQNSGGDLDVAGGLILRLQQLAPP